MESIAIKSETAQANWVAFGLCALSYLMGGTASTLMATFLPVAIPELLGNTVSEAQLSTIGAYISAAFLYGWMAGGLLFGLIGDRMGRVKAVAFVTALYGIANIPIPASFFILVPPSPSIWGEASRGSIPMGKIAIPTAQ